MSTFNTPLEALYACRNHWQWLWITDSFEKSSYEPSFEWAFECACCEFMEHDGDGVDISMNRVCSDCSLTGYAWKDSEDSAPCDVDYTNSIFDEWENSYKYDSSQEYAKQMVDACNRAIEDILTK